MKVYYVLVEWVVDCDSMGSPNIHFFATREDAISKFDVEVKSARVDFHDLPDVRESLDMGDDGNRYYTIYEDGRYCENHIRVVMSKGDIN